MKTTVDIPEDELKDAMRFTKAKTKREAVVKVLEEFNRRRRMAELVKYSGTFSDRFPSNDEIEAVDAERDRPLHGRSRR
jgi:Arc/MetJ family transcription regulator